MAFATNARPAAGSREKSRILTQNGVQGAEFQSFHVKDQIHKKAVLHQLRGKCRTHRAITSPLAQTPGKPHI
jgi:hypothetical protein